MQSFVSLAIGFLLQEGKLSLDDKIVDFYDKDYVAGCGEMVAKQTIRNMLMMSTGHGEDYSSSWLVEKPADVVKYYFETGNRGFCKIP